MIFTKLINHNQLAVHRLLYEGDMRNDGSGYNQKYGHKIRPLPRFLPVRLWSVDKSKSGARRQIYVGHV